MFFVFLCLSCKRVFPALFFLRTNIHHIEQYIYFYIHIEIGRYNVGINCCKEKTAKKEESAGGGGFSFFFYVFGLAWLGLLKWIFFPFSEWVFEHRDMWIFARGFCFVYIYLETMLSDGMSHRFVSFLLFFWLKWK